MRKDRIIHWIGAKRSAFTLIEMLIVLVVVGLLMWVLFQVYQSISRVSLLVRTQKDIGSSLVQVQTILQNVCDTHTLDYGAISGNLIPSQWMTQTLMLRDRLWSGVVIFFSGDMLYMTQWWNTVSLLWPSVRMEHGMFTVFPLKPASEATFDDIYKPGVWVRGVLRPAQMSGLALPIQTYFSFLSQ